MPSIQKLAIIALAMIAIIVMEALQFAVPAFSNKANNKHTNAHLQSIKTEPLKNLQVSNQQEVQQGSLYFTADDSAGTNPKSEQTLSPLLKTDVDIKVTGMIARTRLTQRFKNASEDWVNALYVFPLPENAAVDHLMITVGDRKIEGQIKEKKQALKIFNQAKAEGKKASLVSQLRPNMFSNAIANIGPHETIEVSIEYQQTLTYQDQQYSLRFPMTMTPRYTPNDTETAQLAVEPSYHPENTNTKLRNTNLRVNLKTGFELLNLESEFHPVSTKRLSDGSRHIELTPDAVANKDFVLTWQPELVEHPQISHFKQNVNGQEYGLIMLLPPKPKQNNQQAAKHTNRELIFVLDTSGSMEGQSIVQAKQALILAIQQLAENDSFNVIEFNNHAQNLWKTPLPANSINKNLAIEFVSELNANGGTHMKKAFNLAFNTKNQQVNTNQEFEYQSLRQIVFITDGSVSNEESLMSLIKHKLGDSRLFTVGIGSAPNSYFMTEAAKMGKGTFTYIGATTQVKDKMLTLLNKLKHPAITDLELKVGSHVLTNNQHFEFYPNILSDLYIGEPLIVSYRQQANMPKLVFSNKSTADITLSGIYQNEPWSSHTQSTSSTRQSGLNVLWAREKIAQLTRDKRHASISANNSVTVQDEYQSMITQTALEHHIVSQYTSLVAVDITPTKSHTINSKNTKIPNQPPAGSKNRQRQFVGKLPQTATDAELKLLIGLILIGLSLCILIVTKRKTAFRGA
ncbi:marine proteobacterial sortase target protein [Paraglaciecola aquimarina]|uniref:Marine proteobacterial sortase target protein n=1 Tax=Paraglaciecola algarum TaxID=3050085 RepID=A0ABS9D3F8_9ALTE|nr:marine proteobacterial sortase target protein [Paraglaciecola sp. G1-23]MCF2947459.1 marine proteobacterial sortase target protein [Paraglaciecola sp. G1-23]